MEIFILEQINKEILAAFQKLIPQLTKYSIPPNREALTRIIRSPYSFIFIARGPNKTGEIIGTATLATFHSPTGFHGWIEDVVVDQKARGKGIGRALTEACLGKARELGLHEVNLSSNDTRVAANALYQSMGFIRRETNIYRYPLV